MYRVVRARRGTTRTVTGFAYLTFALAMSFSAVAAERPMNVLFIMGDQHNAGALGCAGNPDVKTPNLDRIAREGVRFSNAFCQTGQCCPSRYTIWTGRYAHSHGLRWNGVREPLDDVTIGEILRDAGYATATIGKHHMMHSPSEHGFEHVVDQPQYRAMVERDGQLLSHQRGDWLPINISGPVGRSHADNEHHPSGFWASEAIQFLDAHADGPFCMWLSFYGPHTPIVPSLPWADMYDPATLGLPSNFGEEREDLPDMLTRGRQKFAAALTPERHREVLAYYYGLVSQIDYNIGRVLDELDRLGLADNTIVVYSADHGEMMGEHCTWTKFTLNYDPTVRIPLLIRAPGIAARGTVVDELVGSVDLMPTLCELTGYDTPDKVQGRSLVPLLRGDDVAWRDVIFSEIGYPGNAAGRCVMARSLTHKYVHHENYGRPFEQLFDMVHDPGEVHNLIDAADQAEPLARLKEAMADWDGATDHAPMYPIQPRPERPRRAPPARSAR